MKVLLINGSPHAKGNTYIALHEMEKIFAEGNIETEYEQKFSSQGFPIYRLEARL